MRAGLFVLSAILSSGCLVTTLQPAFDDESIVFEPALVGTWVREEDGLAVTVERGEWRSYHVAYTDRFGTSKYTAFLTAIGKGSYLIVRPEDGVERQGYLLTSHGVLKIEIADGEVKVAELDYDAALDRMKAATLGIAAGLDVKQNVVITAGTKRLRRWIDAHGVSPGWWGEWKTFVRKGE